MPRTSGAARPYFPGAMDAPTARTLPVSSARFLALGAAAAALYVGAQLFQAWAFRFGLPQGSGIEHEVATRLLPLDRAPKARSGARRPALRHRLRDARDRLPLDRPLRRRRLGPRFRCDERSRDPRRPRRTFRALRRGRRGPLPPTPRRPRRRVLRLRGRGLEPRGLAPRSGSLEKRSGRPPAEPGSRSAKPPAPRLSETWKS